MPKNGQLPVPAEVEQALAHLDAPGEAGGQNGLLAGAYLEEVGEAGLGRDAAQAVTEALLAASHNRTLPPVVQRDAGFILGRLGWQPADLDQFIAIPAGPFLYGEAKRCLHLDQPFALARYPVTNKHYRRFVEAHGYTRCEFWSAEGWRWREGAEPEPGPEARLARPRPLEERAEPFYWRERAWNNPLAPVVGVNVFEAEAYCQWLAQALNRPMRLPTEAEWERAARHVDGRTYPWGDQFDHQRLNCAEFWAGPDLEWGMWIYAASFKQASPTRVGQFPEGNAAAGLSDMSGNVLEWTASASPDRKRRLCGGAWISAGAMTACAERSRHGPDHFGADIGFRVCAPGALADF